MRTLAAAIQFLTVLPVPGGAIAPGRAALFFPLVGAILGALGAGLYLLLVPSIGSSVAALLVLVLWVGITGGLHEDGLADIADAVRAGRPRARILSILKDSRLGVFGGLALLFSVLLRWQALQLIPVEDTRRFVAVLVAAHALSRAAMVALAWVSLPVGEGLAYSFCSTLSTRVALAAIAQGVLAAFWCGPRAGVALVLGVYVILRIAHFWFHRRIGGIVGDSLGATAQIVEIFVLLLFTCRNCTW